MNEFFFLDPGAAADVAKLCAVLPFFGPEAGRYIQVYPEHWKKLLDTNLGKLSQLDQERVKTKLRRAEERLQLISRNRVHYSADRDWLTNALTQASARPPKAAGVVLSAGKPGEKIIVADEIDLPLTAEEKISTSPSEYARVCETILRLGIELYFVDPYIRLDREQYLTVLLSMLKVASVDRKEGRIRLCARIPEEFTKSMLREWTAQLKRLRQESGLDRGRQLELVLFDDEAKKMHARYLFCIRGGVRLDQGFQRLGAHLRVDVSPISRTVLDDLIKIYHEGRTEMTPCETLEG